MSGDLPWLSSMLADTQASEASIFSLSAKVKLKCSGRMVDAQAALITNTRVITLVRQLFLMTPLGMQL